MGLRIELIYQQGHSGSWSWERRTIESEEDGETGLVLGGAETEVDRETKQVGVTDVGPVQEGQEVEQS